MVVICLKNRTFAVSQTTPQCPSYLVIGCDLLEKSYFCSIANNDRQQGTRGRWLWFAWKIVLLQYRKQRLPTIAAPAPSCDLLEKSYFCSIANNLPLAQMDLDSVVICLKNRTFAVSQTTVIYRMYERNRCDLLEKSYFCSIANNICRCILWVEKLWFAWKIVLLQYRKQRTTRWRSANLVVICLKNRTFAVSQTTEQVLQPVFFKLWFAWKIVLLQYRKQHRRAVQAKNLGCDLLEKSYFCSIANNVFCALTLIKLVVICLKNRTFAVSQTTYYPVRPACNRLWFAWKIVLLQYRKQLRLTQTNGQECCDLLEKSYFCSIANNKRTHMSVIRGVVICLKNRTFAVSQTTRILSLFPYSRLWFAWKIVLLQYRKQHGCEKQTSRKCCDLLEKSYFCSIANNSNNRVSRAEVLWFAWKIVLLQYRKQRIDVSVPVLDCCDLLEKSYFCSIANNSSCRSVCSDRVVICLKNRTFAVSQTTGRVGLLHKEVLWFAWKIVLLQYRKQQKNLSSISSTCCDLLEKSYFCSIANNP